MQARAAGHHVRSLKASYEKPHTFSPPLTWKNLNSVPPNGPGLQPLAGHIATLPVLLLQPLFLNRSFETLDDLLVATKAFLTMDSQSTRLAFLYMVF